MGIFQEPFLDLNISFEPLNENGSFSSGDFMTGEISFAIWKITKIRSIVISPKGRALVLWTKRKRARRTITEKTYSAEVDFFDFTALVLEENPEEGPTILQPGTHVYPFTFKLPEGNFPSTFHGVHGRVVYSLKVEIRRPWHLAKEFEVEFNFANHIDANHPKLLHPLSCSEETMVCCLWCASGPIKMTARLDRKGYVPGETIIVMCEFSNASSRNAIPTASLMQHEKYSTLAGSRKIDNKSLDLATGEFVKGGNLQAYSEMRLTIPDTTFLSISNCSIIEVTYTVLVTLSINWSSDMSVSVPIVLCDIPVDSEETGDFED